MDTIKTTTSAMLPHSAAPLPGYESLRYLLDALAKRAARAAGVPETGVCMPLYREEYDAMTLPERAKLCRAAHLAFNDTKHPIPVASPFDTLNSTTHEWAIGGDRYYVWYTAMGNVAAERTGIAKLEIKRLEPFGNLRMDLSILFDLEPDNKAAADMPYTLTLPTDWCKVVDMLAATWPRVELLTPGQFDALVEGWRLAHEQKAGA